MQCFVVDENRKAELEKIKVPVPTPLARVVKYDSDVCGQVELTEAEVIVSSGRGMKKALNYVILDDLFKNVNRMSDIGERKYLLLSLCQSLRNGKIGESWITYRKDQEKRAFCTTYPRDSWSRFWITLTKV
jgi:hypothetical protein